ncbi:hypothetical protein ACOKM5_41400 [Streptomyces sp. BH097]|uniref:hypothetical protein n=1 Tax=unclassified Streptomyces TaxID=2593676 RepID=UPI003BB7E1CF
MTSYAALRVATIGVSGGVLTVRAAGTLDHLTGGAPAAADEREAGAVDSDPRQREDFSR